MNRGNQAAPMSKSRIGSMHMPHKELRNRFRLPPLVRLLVIFVLIAAGAFAQAGGLLGLSIVCRTLLGWHVVSICLYADRLRNLVGDLDAGRGF